MRDAMEGQQGFSLIELMASVAVLAVLMAVAVPALQDFVRAQAVSTRISAFHQDVVYARSEAVKRQQEVLVDAIDNDWERGWQVYADVKRNGKFDAGEETVLREQGAVSEGYSMDGADAGGAGRAQLGFDGRGTLVGGGTVNVLVCAPGWNDGKDEQLARNVRVQANGRAEAARGKGKGKGLACK